MYNVLIQHISSYLQQALAFKKVPFCLKECLCVLVVFLLKLRTKVVSKLLCNVAEHGH